MKFSSIPNVYDIRGIIKELNSFTAKYYLYYSLFLGFCIICSYNRIVSSKHLICSALMFILDLFFLCGIHCIFDFYITIIIVIDSSNIIMIMMKNFVNYIITVHDFHSNSSQNVYLISHQNCRVKKSSINLNLWIVKMSGYKIHEIEKLFQQGIPPWTVFQHIMSNPKRYCYPDIIKFMEEYPEEYPEEYEQSITNLGLNAAYSKQLKGTFIIRKLLEMGFNERFLIKYVVYPKTYQFKISKGNFLAFRTHLPFVDYIKPVSPCDFPQHDFCSGPVIEEYIGLQLLDKSPSDLPVIRYAVPGGGTEFEETPEDVCGCLCEVIYNFALAYILKLRVILY